MLDSSIVQPIIDIFKLKVDCMLDSSILQPIIDIFN